MTERDLLSPVDAAPAPSLSPRYPPWVLDKRAYIEDRENATTAEATTSTGRAVKVTFCLADPPAVSHFCVHGPELALDHFAEQPTVVYSVKDLVLLRFAFTAVGAPQSTPSSNPLYYDEYFLYKAGRGKPSLRRIPSIDQPGKPISRRVGVFPGGALPGGETEGYPAEGEFLLVALAPADVGPRDFNMLTFSSETNKWRTKLVHLEIVDGVDLSLLVPHKVISLGEGCVGLVDLMMGILAVDMKMNSPWISYIPLPKPQFGDSSCALNTRDVTFIDSVFKFVEIEPPYTKVTTTDNKKRKMMSDPVRRGEMIHDWHLLVYEGENFYESDNDDKEPSFAPDGWKIWTYTRHTSWRYWLKGDIVHADDILANNPRHAKLFPQLWDSTANNLKLRNLATTPSSILSSYRGDFVYLTSTESGVRTGWVIGLNLRSKTVEVIEPYTANRAIYVHPAFLQSAFSEYLNTTQGSFSISQAYYSDGIPNNYTIHGGGYDPSVTANQHSQPCAVELNCTPMGARCVTHNNLTPQQNLGVWNSPSFNRTSYACAPAANPGYGHYQQPPLSQRFMWPPNGQQPLLPIPMSSGSGSLNLVNIQPTYPVVTSSADGKLWITVPLNDHTMSLLPSSTLLPAHESSTGLLPSSVAANSAFSYDDQRRPVLN